VSLVRPLLEEREMRITGSRLILACLLIGGATADPVAIAQAKYGVVVQTVKPEVLANAKTYVWTVTRPSFDKTIDTQIVAAVDRELSARGFTKRPSGPSDITVTYASVSRTDIDLKTSTRDGAPNESAVGTLTVDLTNPTTRELLFRVRVDTPIEKSSTALESVINASVKAMFEKYPSPPKR
jgi:hypothetical protein